MIIIKNMVRIDKRLAEPVYLQLSKGIAGIIEQGLLKPGTALPSSRKLAEYFDIHRKTVIAAFDELQAMGWAESMPRKGLFVATTLPVVRPRAVAAARGGMGAGEAASMGPGGDMAVSSGGAAAVGSGGASAVGSGGATAVGSGGTAAAGFGGATAAGIGGSAAAGKGSSETGTGSVAGKGGLAAAGGRSAAIGGGLTIPGPVPGGKMALVYPDTTAFAIEKRQYLYEHDFIARKERLVFNDGFPDTRLAPVELLIREYRRFSNYRFTAKYLSYGPVQGSENLRNELARFLNHTRGLNVSPANIMITKGAQMAMYLVSQLLLKKGDEVVVGEPGYLGASEVFRTAGANLNFVPVDDDGLDISAVEKICRKKKVRMLYVIPHHHTPTTVTLCAERRQQLLELARKYQFAVLEDDYDFDFHYASSPILPLCSIDYSGNVIYVGSFCKTVAPAIRIGFLVAPVNLVEQAKWLRKLVDRQGEQLMEEAMANLLRNGDIDRHLKKANKIYHERRDLLCSLLRRELGGLVEFDVPAGGFAIYVRFGDLDMRAIAAQAQRLGLGIADGADYWHNKANRVNSVRLGFASLNEKEMEEAVGLLKKAVALVR